MALNLRAFISFSKFVEKLWRNENYEFTYETEEKKKII